LPKAFRPSKQPDEFRDVTQPSAIESNPHDVRSIAAKAVLLDIEGTISPIRFVRDVLFPYSKSRLRPYIAENSDNPAVRDILAQAEALSEGRDAIDALADWQDRDVKAPPLKKLQGLIWDSGYRSGALVSSLFADVLPQLTRWRASGIPLYVYSSGSVQAQLLFFEFNADGDLRSLFSGFFDTEIGAKTEASSYLRIMERTGQDPHDVVFFSDNALELAAARGAGLQIAHVVKDETLESPDFPSVYDFGQIFIAPAKSAVV
jgi:enolase-phosphatase E1